jgi:hypothetical protein
MRWRENVAAARSEIPETAFHFGFRRQLAKNVVGSLRYGFFEYVEDSTGGINNYRANVVTASCAIRF